MDNTLIFLLAVTIAGIMFTAFSGMVKKSARHHQEEEEEMRRREEKARLARRLAQEQNQSRQSSGYQLDDTAIKWYRTTVSPTTQPNTPQTKSEIEEYEEC